MALNEFSDLWLNAFLDQRNSHATQREADFLTALLSPDSTILDIPCGYGRHGAILTTFGHNVTGVDRDARMLSRARLACTAVQAEMRDLPFAANSFDAALNMWHSFGYFSAAENAAILSELARIVRRGGLLVLDLYTRSFYESVPGERRFERAGVTVQETTTLRGDRVNVRLAYGGGPVLDEFEWQVFTPQEVETMASGAGWRLASRFADFNIDARAGDDSQRIQYAFRSVR